jgi:hypothetical protein
MTVFTQTAHYQRDKLKALRFEAGSEAGQTPAEVIHQPTVRLDAIDLAALIQRFRSL